MIGQNNFGMKSTLENRSCYYGGYQFAKFKVFKEKKIDMIPPWDHPIEK